MVQNLIGTSAPLLPRGGQHVQLLQAHRFHVILVPAPTFNAIIQAVVADDTWRTPSSPSRSGLVHVLVALPATTVAILWQTTLNIDPWGVFFVQFP